jgi:hypothetical protein
MARPALTYRAARRNISREAGVVWAKFPARFDGSRRCDSALAPRYVPYQVKPLRQRIGPGGWEFIPRRQPKVYRDKACAA